MVGVENGRCIPFYLTSLLNFYFALVDEVGGAGEGDVGEGGFSGLFETDGEGIAAFDINLDGAFGSGEKMMDECTGDHAGAAGKGLSLDAALVGANGDMIGSEDAGKVRVCAVRCEVLVFANGAAETDDVAFFQVLDEGDGVWDAGVE